MRATASPSDAEAEPVARQLPPEDGRVPLAFLAVNTAALTLNIKNLP